MKEFDLEQAKAGKPVCTRDGRKARILCFDLKGADSPICAAVEGELGIEFVYRYNFDGRYYSDRESINDLMMAGEKHTGWVNIWRKDKTARYTDYKIFPSEEKAKELGRTAPDHYITTVKIEWEE